MSQAIPVHMVVVAAVGVVGVGVWVCGGCGQCLSVINSLTTYQKSSRLHVVSLPGMLARVALWAAMVAGAASFGVNQMPGLQHVSLSLRGQPRRASACHGLKMAVKDLTSESDLDSTIAAAGSRLSRRIHAPYYRIPFLCFGRRKSVYLHLFPGFILFYL
jgi:hypothetical protein